MNFAAIWRRSTSNSSLMGLLGVGARDAAQQADGTDRVELIREAILAALSLAGQAAYPLLTRRVRFAQDPHTLWFLRADLMAALADLHGERSARDKVAAVSDMFDGLLPASLLARARKL